MGAVSWIEMSSSAARSRIYYFTQSYAYHAQYTFMLNILFYFNAILPLNIEILIYTTTQARALILIMYK